MAGPSLSILTINQRVDLETLLVRLGANVVRAGDDDDLSFYVGESDPSPFVIGYQAADLESEAQQSEYSRALLRDKLGDVPTEVLSVGAMCNQKIDHLRLAQIVVKLGQALGSVIGLELYAPLPKDVATRGWCHLLSQGTCTEPIPYELYEYVVDASVLRAWSLHKDFHLVK